MRVRATAGNILFPLAVMGLGFLSLVTGHFAAVWEPVPKGLPARHILAYGNGVLMLALGAGLLTRLARAHAALLLTDLSVRSLGGHRAAQPPRKRPRCPADASCGRASGVSPGGARAQPRQVRAIGCPHRDHVPVRRMMAAD